MNDRDWRNRYYAMTIVHTLTVAVELNNQRKRSWPGPRPFISLFNSRNSSENLSIGPKTLPSLILSPNFDDGSEHNAQRNDFGAHTPATSPAPPLSQASSPGPDVDLARSTNEWKCCYVPECVSSFSGKLADRKKNFRRHIEDMHKGSRTYPCIFPDCEKEYKEERNLQRHVKKAHSG